MSQKSVLMDNFEQAVKEGSQRIIDQAHALNAAIGDRPYGQQFVPLKLQAQQYQLVRNNVAAWQGIIQTHGAKAALDYAQRGERLTGRFPDQAEYGQQALQGDQLLAEAQQQGGTNAIG